MSGRGSATSFFRRVFEDNQEKVVVTNGNNGATYSYSDLIQSADLLCEFLRSKGIERGSKVAYILENDVRHFILLLGAFLGGYIAVPVDPWRGKAEITRILDVVEPDILVTGEHTDVDDKRPRLKGQVMIDEINLKPGTNVSSEKKASIGRKFLSRLEVCTNAELDLKDRDQNAPFLITFTSGSTGDPKGVIHSFRNIYKTAFAFDSFFNFGSSNICHHNFPMAYMAGILNQFFLPLLKGCSIVVGDRFSIAGLSRFWEIPATYGINTFWLNPTIMSLLVKMDRGDEGVAILSRPDVTISVGTAPLPIKLKNEFEARYKTRVYESYGLSETLFVSTNSPQFSQRAGSVGKLLPGVKLSNANDGELMIDVPWMLRGVLGTPNQKDDQKQLENGFPSGDLGHVDEDGYVFITGRKKDIIIRGGINISPQRIERYLDHLGSFAELTVVGTPDDVLGERIVCFFTAKSEVPKDELKNINKLLVEELGRDDHIDEFRQLASIPKNINGKVDKLALRTLAKDRGDLS